MYAHSCLTLCEPMACSRPLPPAPLSMGCSRQESWSGLPFPSPGYISYTSVKEKRSAFTSAHSLHHAEASEPAGSQAPGAGGQPCSPKVPVKMGTGRASRLCWGLPELGVLHRGPGRKRQALRDKLAVPQVGWMGGTGETHILQGSQGR